MDARPSILFIIADDASWCHFRAYGEKAVQTPHFDSVAREGALFQHAYCASPSCTPSRGAILTGQHIWRLGEGGNLWSFWPNTAPIYTDLLATTGYKIGLTGKGWSPGDFTKYGRKDNPAGPPFANFDAFLATLPPDTPFCFWFGSQNPHRTYKKGSGLARGKKLESVTVPPFLPDTPEVRSDLLDYLSEIEDFDAELGRLLAALERTGRAQNTLVVVTSDNGFPFPHGKTNLYDAGTRMPLAMRWPGHIKPGTVSDALVSHTDFAPTFLEAAGIKIPDTVTGQSLLSLLTSPQPLPASRRGSNRDVVYFGRERHFVKARMGNAGYPVRAVRTRDFLYIHNLAPDRWPAGDPPLFSDIDQADSINGSPSKQAVVEGSDRRFAAWATEKRPAEELYDLKADPHQLTNVTADPKHAKMLARLRTQLDETLRKTGDPRVSGKDDFDRYPSSSGPRK
ncbi:sulfatase [Armatimonas sp.]|uniref:sulfatase family protein n=1 Tax=Armatimonas sp. TaxID=1872638 RepID=UPI00375055A5